MPFTPQGQGLEVFDNRYASYEGETWDGASLRTARVAASAEKTPADVDSFTKVFYDMISENLFMPGGRIMYGAGRRKGQMLNCFVVPTADSREGWGKAVSDVIVVCGTGGGVGLAFTPVRGRGAEIFGSGGHSTGAVSLQEIINAAGEVIKAGGGRRTALMFGLGLQHPDIVEFLDAKLDLKKLNNANVSVIFDNDPEEFFRLVKADETLDLKFAGQIVGRVKAKDLWFKMVSNASKGGEPGLLNGYYANRMSNIWYIAPLICTNPCGEIWLSAYDCCCLGSIVLPRFVSNNSLDWGLLQYVVKQAVRFLDNILTVNNYPLQEIAETCQNLRRIGLGITGLHDMLIRCGKSYNSPEGLEFVDKVMRFIKNEAYKASCLLAKEKGAFPKFDSGKYLKSNFIKTLKPSIRRMIEENGIRNAALLTIAPVGTGSIVCGVSSGIEPLFAPAYERKWRKGDELKSEVIIHPLFDEFIKQGWDTSNFTGTYDLKLRDHFEMQRVCQKHVDNAVSKTINIMRGTSIEELSELYMEYLPELKGVTVYPEGSRENQPLTPLSIEQALAYVGKTTIGGVDSCKTGACEL